MGFAGACYKGFAFCVANSSTNISTVTSTRISPGVATRAAGAASPVYKGRCGDHSNLTCLPGSRIAQYRFGNIEEVVCVEVTISVLRIPLYITVLLVEERYAIFGWECIDVFAKLFAKWAGGSAGIVTVTAASLFSSTAQFTQRDCHNDACWYRDLFY